MSHFTQSQWNSTLPWFWTRVWANETRSKQTNSWEPRIYSYSIEKIIEFYVKQKRQSIRTQTGAELKKYLHRYRGFTDGIIVFVDVRLTNF